MNFGHDMNIHRHPVDSNRVVYALFNTAAESGKSFVRI